MTFQNIKSSFTLLMIIAAMAVPHKSESSDNLVRLIDQIRVENHISAALIIIVDKDKVLTQAHLGKQSWQSDAPFNQSNMFRIGSISKSFAAILTMKLQQLGIIDITKPINYYLKNESIKNTFTSEITLQHLLEHTAGLQDLKKAEWDYNKSTRKTIEQALALKLGDHVSQWEPGLHSSYSNVGAGYLGLVLEKASGKSYEQLMHEYVFKPLAMQSSTLFLENHVSQRLIKGYNTDGKTLIPYWHNIYRPFAAINTDANDMVNFLKLLINNGEFKKLPFLSPIDISRIESPKTTLAAKSGLQYGYGLGNYSWQTNGYTFHGHGGDADGYLSRFGYNRDSGMAYFVMINAFKHKPLKHIRDLVEFHITKDLAKPRYPKRIKLSDKYLDKYSGDYHQVTSRFKPVSRQKKPAFKIIKKDQSLYIQYTYKNPIAIYAVNNKHFRYPNESVATMAFIDYDGKIYFQGDSGNFVKVE